MIPEKSLETFEEDLRLIQNSMQRRGNLAGIQIPPSAFWNSFFLSELFLKIYHGYPSQQLLIDQIANFKQTLFAIMHVILFGRLSRIINIAICIGWTHFTLLLRVIQIRIVQIPNLFVILYFLLDFRTVVLARSNSQTLHVSLRISRWAGIGL